MSFINWGEETSEQKAIRARLEQDALFEQAVRIKMQSQGGVGGGSISSPLTLVGSVDWLVVAPEGLGSEGDDYSSFEFWETEEFAPISGVSKLTISSGSANGHVHGDDTSCTYSIELYDQDTDQWIEVWSYEQQNPNYPEDDSEDFFMNGVTAVFPTIGTLTKIRVNSDPYQHQTYHDWDQDSTIFNFYG
jgi:hypothetical protein